MNNRTFFILNLIKRKNISMKKTKNAIAFIKEKLFADESCYKNEAPKYLEGILNNNEFTFTFF